MAKDLYDRLLKLRQDANSVGSNPVFDFFELDRCEKLDVISTTDSFVKKRVDSILRLLNKTDIDFDLRHTQALQDYAEALFYLDLKEKGISVEQHDTSKSVSEADFHVFRSDGPNNTYDVNAELKTPNFCDEKNNYVRAQEDALNAAIELEERSKKDRIAFAEYEIQPMCRLNAATGKIDSPDLVGEINVMIRKINGLIKASQFAGKDTILIVDIKQLPIGNHRDEEAAAHYVDPRDLSICSGILWNIAFGQKGDRIFVAPEFEGSSNIGGSLEFDGILKNSKYKFVKALVFIDYRNFKERRYIGFYRYKDVTDNVLNAITDMCDFYNDDTNSMAFKILQRDKENKQIN